jgi:predicted nucleic acid-binding protein
MTTAVLADTGPLYAAADVDDAYHARARRELKILEREKREVLLAYPTLCEAYTLVLHRLGRKSSERWLGEVMSGVSLINPLPDDYRQAAKRLRLFPDQPITLFDATLAVVGLRLGIEVWTYDHHFDILGATVWR